MSNKDFINTLSQKIDSIPDFPVRKSLAISQACLESRYGAKHFYNNIFGIKCHDINKYAGCRLGSTSEVINGSYQHNLKLAFQVYDSIDDSIQDYADLMRKDRYQRVRQALHYIDATQAVKDCGYATSLTYINSLQKIIETNKLYELDYKMKDHYITQHFKYSEFFCRGEEPPQIYYDNIVKVATELEKLREIVKRPIRINSGWRSPEVNKLLGGAKNSQHLTGKACDIKVSLFNNKNVPLYACRYTGFNGIGVGVTYTHLDTRDNFTIWYY